MTGAGTDRTGAHTRPEDLIVVSGDERPHVHRPHPLPTLQKLVNAGAGSTALTILVNRLVDGEAIPEHVHDVEEVLIVVEGGCTVSSGGRPFAAKAGDAVIIPPGVLHAVEHAGASTATVVAALASATALPD